MKRILTCVAIAMALILSGCASAPESPTDNMQSSTGVATEQASIAHRYASASEGTELLLSNDNYYAGFSQNDLDFRMQKKGATLDELKAFAAKQVLDFTDEEKALIDGCLAEMTNSLTDHGYALPPLDEITFVKTTMAEESGASGYTHGTTIFAESNMLDAFISAGEGIETEAYLTEFLWHEIFHCLTRSNPDFRASMYELINFTVHDVDYTLPPSVMEYHISNPDVEHHDSSAIFSIDGKDVECFCDFVTTRHFEKKGDTFFDCNTTALVPVDGTDTYYTPEQAANFDDVFGTNTSYVVDPEECMADNFSYALTYGTEGKDGNGYESPEIIEGVIAYLSH